MAVPGSQPRRRPAFGLLLLGIGQARGLSQFGGDPDSYLGSLAPLLGLQIVMALLFTLRAGISLASLFFLIVVCNLLAPPVIGHVFCALWGRRALWPLYANVLNWSVWLMVAVLLVLLPAASMTLSAGVSPTAAASLLLGVLAVYVLWFHWFLARHALQVSRARAFIVMASVVFGTGLLVQAPIWIGDVTGLQPTPELAPELPALSPPNGSDK
jgi:hypothetical protein